MIAISFVVSWLSDAFAYGTSGPSRPIPLVLLLFAVAFMISVGGIVLALRCRHGKTFWCLVLIPALVSRVLLLFSHPIQEIDIYRYVWDGAVVANGVNPYHFSPQDVLLADAANFVTGELASLARLRDESPPLAEILRRVHYAELSSVYPPVSQAVFAFAHWLTPSGASLHTRLIIFKAVFLAFDFATIFLIVQLLALTGKHAGWIIAYAWSPLVLKEFANSGHLDAIAVFLTTSEIVVVTRYLLGTVRIPSASVTLFPGILLGLAVGAKLYPIVLLPLLLAITAARLSWRHAAFLGSSAVITGTVALSPMLFASPVPTVSSITAPTLPLPAGHPEDIACLKESPPERVATHPLDGLRTFLNRWEMNDFLFLIVFENLRPSEPSSLQSTPWFAVIPVDARNRVATRIATHFSISPDNAALLAARVICAGLFLAVAFGLAWRAARRPTGESFLEAAFLTLAWFWLLSPTQNPWYWIWALPLIPFARGKAWIALSGLVLVYYLRFWFVYHWPESKVLGTSYLGAEFFDFVVTWMEYAPWFISLGCAAVLRSVLQTSLLSDGQRQTRNMTVPVQHLIRNQH